MTDLATPESHADTGGASRTPLVGMRDIRVSFGGVHADGDRFGQCGIRQIHALRHPQQPTLRLANQHQIGQPALGGSVADAPQLVVAGVDHHPVAYSEPIDVRADGFDHAG